MALTVSDVRTARFFPEILPATEIRTIAASSFAQPLPLDIRRFGRDRYLELRNLFLDRNADVVYTITGDDFQIERNAGAVDNEPMDTIISALNNIQYKLFNEDSVNPQTDYSTHFGLLIDRPTVATKIKFGIDLNEEEQRIDEELGISNSVEKGVLPLPYSFVFEREYQIIDKYIVSSRVETVPTTGEGAVFENFSVNPGEALILSAVGADPFLVADDFRVIIDRDNDTSYITVRPFAMNSLNNNIECWIPAVRELRFRAIAANAINNADIRLIINRVVLTNTLRVRWGLLQPEDAPGDLGIKVLGGVL